jgi:iron complex transport system ATP-binding protein
MIELEMRKATLGYRHRPVLRDISFTAKPGDLVGLIGPNGSGKSTILKTMSRIITPLGGTVLVDGRDLSGYARQDLARRVGVVPQLPLLPSTFTAFEIVLMGRNPHLGLFQHETRHDYDLARDAMEKTGTFHLADRHINELSGGEIQSVLIARVLVQETDSILLDEPTANLDIGRQIEVMDLISRLCREQKLTVIAAIHDLNLAAQYCTRLLLISQGRLYAEGTPAEVITDENIAAVYGAGNTVFTHPVNGLPAVLIGGHLNGGYRSK